MDQFFYFILKFPHASTFSDLGLEGQSEDSTVAGPSNIGSVMETGSAKDKLEQDKWENDKFEVKRQKDKNRKDSADPDKVKRYLFHSLL